MKSHVRAMIITGGVLNLLLAFFHIFLCYQIFIFYGSMNLYPLLEMFSVGGTLMVFFLAYTSLFCPADLAYTKSGKAVIVLNILVYLSRVLGEFILFPKQNIWIIVLCSFLTVLYVYIFTAVRTKSQKEQSLSV
jgi:hypothetical protein